MKIRTVIKQPGHKPAVLLMENGLENFERFVKGDLSNVRFATGCVVIHNPEWRKLGMKKNMKFLGQEFGGPVVFAESDGHGFCGLTEDQAQQIMALIK